MIIYIIVILLSSVEQLEEFRIWHEHDLSEDNFCELEGIMI